MEEVFLKYGLLGVIVMALGIYIIRLEERHRKERKEEREENREVQEKQFDRINEMSDESNRVLRENTNILSGLKSLLENHRK